MWVNYFFHCLYSMTFAANLIIKYGNSKIKTDILEFLIVKDMIEAGFPRERKSGLAYQS